ncbi:MAG TPA: SPFH domain-containing protein [Streptosporangiaceae bacterium]|jgi:regulator of protease activity HflC (stomatin/prohibitin superfamily)
MEAQVQAVPGSEQRPFQQVPEHAAWALPGLRMLVTSSAVLILGIVLLVVSAPVGPGGGRVTLIILGIAAIVTFSVLIRGLIAVAPGQARVVQLFGRYRGTVREPGMHWVNPFTVRIMVSTRIRNQESAQVKVNDADGNPIEIAAVIVWQVEDTAHAIYAVDNYVHFVGVQAETAVRHVASSYAYDSRGSGALSLRDNADEITAQLSAELANRVTSAGVQIIETRLTRLSYAPEIAQAMLRQQQASAVVGARQRIVEGAVGMVRMALERLDQEGVVELDEERKAAMVSNLLVVLCSEQATQQVVNTGSLYQ